ncbi:DUF4292 domain-containing protein [Kaistella flava (ex Peng et al. 2021)]|uniref:DUF4292 domain-containing protein n=1 Tax=Kaistella flava (ex Peng et al. 2021) TaxID=2038776 RepID=A0A7M2YCK5_9FLAO|nr:DUF4292 domain-containing protein [Kaistella flava (ex Peng et al. 2021)]QOW11364.1 DUF4292 domain-containing protein [Kaistella flava (ex Peng et al. 2021)]
MKKYILASALMIALISCKTKTAVENPISTNTPIASNANFFNKINEKADFQQLKINSRITAETGKFIPPLDATIYIEKDKKVWINMVAIFLNVGRGIATPEGIKGYEKLNKTYIESDFSYLNSLLNVDFIDYGAFQNLLLGRTFIPVNDKDFKLTKNAQGYVLTSIKNLSFQTNGAVSEYSASLSYNDAMDLENVSLQKLDAPDQLEVSYSNWENFENTKLPKNVKIIIKGSKNGQILLENTKFDSSKMDAPYSVPNNYTKTEIK